MINLSKSVIIIQLVVGLYEVCQSLLESVMGNLDGQFCQTLLGLVGQSKRESQREIGGILGALRILKLYFLDSIPIFSQILYKNFTLASLSRGGTFRAQCKHNDESWNLSYTIHYSTPQTKKSELFLLMSHYVEGSDTNIQYLKIMIVSIFYVKFVLKMKRFLSILKKSLIFCGLSFQSYRDLTGSSWTLAYFISFYVITVLLLLNLVNHFLLLLYLSPFSYIFYLRFRDNRQQVKSLSYPHMQKV